MVGMDSLYKSLALIAAVLLASGCLGRGAQEAPPPVYITPCNVIGENILIEAVGNTLGADIIKNPLSKAFVDDLLSEQAKDALASYTLTCWWGKNVGEKRDLYYCSGSYTAPELSDEKVIKRYVRKNFKVGFEVEERPPTTWTLDGTEYAESGFYYLTVRSVEAVCTLAV